MKNELDEINSMIQEGNDMVALMEMDKFKAFYEKVTKELRINLVGAYNTPEGTKKKAIEDQMIFSAGLENYCKGVIQMGEMAEVELEQLNNDQESQLNEEGAA